ncbi:MAG: hypothetical protein ACU85E_08275 [Gammaproteobacteria bacterium]
MKNRMKQLALSALLLLGLSITAQAGQFWVTGNVLRTLSDGFNYGGCMIYLSTPINNGCPASGWVSLDCNGGYNRAGERNYASALMAFSLNKTVSVLVDNTQKYNGYCVVRRMDVIN